CSSDIVMEPAVLKRVAEKLQLMRIDDLTEESLALTEMISTTDRASDERIKKMCNLLNKIKDFVQTKNPDLGASKFFLLQTYERSYIEKWIGADHYTCPKTQQTLQNSSLTPNYVQRSLIAQWCEANGVKLPKRPGSSNLNKLTSACSAAERSKIDELLHKLHSGNPKDLRSVAGEIRLLAKQNADNRVAITEAGAISLLKDAASALFNLCIYQGNKGKEVRAGIVPTLMKLLTEPGGGMLDEALIILAIIAIHSEGKFAIGSADALPVLVDVIANESPRNKDNAAAVLVHLCSGDPNYLTTTRDLRIMSPLLEMTQSGTKRGKRKAQQLLERMNRLLEQQKQS
ncbi:U-box domain-containing protein 13, partial [Bienertia sinuspersici]